MGRPQEPRRSSNVAPHWEWVRRARTYTHQDHTASDLSTSFTRSSAKNPLAGRCFERGWARRDLRHASRSRPSAALGHPDHASGRLRNGGVLPTSRCGELARMLSIPPGRDDAGRPDGGPDDSTRGRSAADARIAGGGPHPGLSGFLLFPVQGGKTLAATGPAKTGLDSG